MLLAVKRYEADTPACIIVNMNVNHRIPQCISRSLINPILRISSILSFSLDESVERRLVSGQKEVKNGYWSELPIHASRPPFTGFTSR